MSQINRKKETPEIYSPGDQVAIWKAQYSIVEIVGIYTVKSITAHEAILKDCPHKKIPLKKEPYHKPELDVFEAKYSFKPVDQEDLYYLELKDARARTVKLIQDLRDFPVKSLALDAIKELNTTLEAIIKSIEL